MKRFNSLFLLLAAFLLIALVSTLSAQVHRGIEAKPRVHREMMENRLDLTDEQKSKMADLRLAHQKENLPLRTELQGKMADLRLLKTEANPNLNKIDQAIEQAEKIRTKLQKVSVRHQLEVRKILTPEQQKLWDSRTLQGRGQQMMGRKFRGAPDQF
jgi:Spy/CpxP family protein refolding chaperone